MVFAYHGLSNTVIPTTRLSKLVHGAAVTGWVGVDLFFVLSGFLITTILLDARAAENYFKVFYIRRGLRIFPLYYAVLIAVLLTSPGHIPYRTQLFFWLNLSNLPTAFHPRLIGALAHFWSLAIEEQFYFVWPAVVRWLRARTLAYVCIAIIAGLFLVRNLPPVLAANAHWPELIYRLTPFRIDTLAAGALLAVLAQRWPDLSRHRLHMRVLCIGAGGIFLIVGFGRSYSETGVPRFGYTALVVCFFSLVGLALYPGSATARIFSNAFLRKTGKYSYSFYLLHPFVVNYIFMHNDLVLRVCRLLRLPRISSNLLAVGVFLLEFAVLMGICALCWNFFEGPILRLKRHFRYRPVPEHLLA